MRSLPRAVSRVAFAAIVAVAPAAFGACPALTVEADAAVRDRWPALEAQIRDAFASRRDVDACARVYLTAGDPITAEVTLPDHRVASRTVSHPEDVVSALEALLLVPDSGDRSEYSAASAEPAAAAAAPTIVSTRLDGEAAVRDRGMPGPSSPRSVFGVELSAALTGRVGDGKGSVGLALVSYVELAQWLLGFQGRLDHYTSGAGDADDALELAALAGHRFEVASLALDVVGGPAVAFAGGSRVTVAHQGTPPPDPPAPPGPSERLLLGATVHFGGRSTFHTFAGVDVDIATSTVASKEANLPVWALGLALGATLGTSR